MNLKINELLKTGTDKDGAKITFDGLLVEKKTMTKSNGDLYFNVTFQDCTGKIEFPLWSDYDFYNESLQEKAAYFINGTVNHWNGAVQVKNPSIIVIDGEWDLSDFVPTYDVPQEVYDYFINTVKGLAHPYGMIAKAATGCDNYDKKRWTAFSTCVSAEKYHGNKRKGLLLHTVGVMKSVEAVINNYVSNPYFYDAKNVINSDRLMLKAILHDIKKTEEYDYDSVIRYKPGKKVDHIVSGVAYLKEINYECGEILSEEDIEDISYSILSHHGQWGPYEAKSLEDILLHLADMIDAKVVGAVEK